MEENESIDKNHVVGRPEENFTAYMRDSIMSRQVDPEKNRKRSGCPCEKNLGWGVGIRRVKRQ